RKVEHRCDSERIDRAHRRNPPRTVDQDGVAARAGGEGIRDEDLAARGVAVNEVACLEAGKRRFDVDAERGCPVRELNGLRAAAVSEALEDPAVQRPLALAQLLEARRTEARRRDSRRR